MSQSILNRSIQSVKWNVAGNVVTIVFGFVQTVWLARLLLVETFGVYAFAQSIIWLTKVIAAMGFGGAFLNRAEETQDEDFAASVFLSLRLITTFIWVVLLLGTTFILVSDVHLRLALTVLTLANAVTDITLPANSVLVRRVNHKRLAIIQVFNSIITAIATIGLAMLGFELWALLSSAIVTAIVSVFLLYIWKPAWKPRLRWSMPSVRYYMQYGFQIMSGRVLLHAFDRIDDIWTGLFLGKTAVGFYSQAYTFATYPRLALAQPINQVIAGTYAELHDKPEELSKAFSESNRLMIRVSFLLAGGLALIAPEFIQLLLGDKWLPMLNVFRFMLLFTMLDPIRETTANLFTSIGKPEVVVQTRVIQLLLLVIGLLIMGSLADIVGVAIAVNIALVVGIGHTLWHAKRYVSFSITSLFFVPVIALLGGLLSGYLIQQSAWIAQYMWLLLVVKSIIFTLVYGGIWLMFEWKSLLNIIQMNMK